MTQELMTPSLKSIVDERVTDEYIKAGFAKNVNGEVTRDEEAMKARAYDIVSKAVVSDKTHRSTKSLTNGELYAQVFPGGPGTVPGTADQLDEIEAEVRSTLMRKVWSLTNPSVRGFIQRRLGDSSSLVLCRGTVVRDLDEMVGVYVTDDPALIMDESLTPEIEKLVRAANNLREHATMINARHPELEQRVAAALGSGVSRARSAAQLSAPSQNGASKALNN